MGMGIKSLKWEGIGTKNLFPHTSSVDLPREGSRRCALWPNYIERLFTLSDFIFESKGSRYSITERRVPELIPVIGSQPAGDVSHIPGGRLPYVTFHQACSYPRNP